MASARSARRGRLFLPGAHLVGAPALRLRPHHAGGVVGASAGVHGTRGSTLVDDRSGDSVLSPRGALPASGTVPARPESVRPSGADEHRAALGAARRAAPLLQHDRLHPHDRGDVLPPVSARGGRTAGLHVRLAPAAVARGTRLTAFRHGLLGLVCGAVVAGAGCGTAAPVYVSW